MFSYNMKKTFLLLVLILSFAAALRDRAAADNALRLIKAGGSVNIRDIGGNGLYIFSLWDNNKGSPVSGEGDFVTTISDHGPQKLAVKDDRKTTRALMIVLPGGPRSLTFDAKSTAAAILFQDPGSMESPSRVEAAFRKMEGSRSFQDLVGFLKKNLPQRSLEELMDDPGCSALLEKCNAEIFGEDKAAIQRSLHQAEAKLQKLFQEK
ncbi:MAG: hypothetical protein NTU54_02460 [Candidatus Omnitrophica bacterium]|nr:hypothetical protein [Candidatus Omnitrophota bacterium]